MWNLKVINRYRRFSMPVIFKYEPENLKQKLMMQWSKKFRWKGGGEELHHKPKLCMSCKLSQNYVINLFWKLILASWNCLEKLKHDIKISIGWAVLWVIDQKACKILFRSAALATSREMGPPPSLCNCNAKLQVSPAPATSLYYSGTFICGTFMNLLLVMVPCEFSLHRLIGHQQTKLWISQTYHFFSGPKILHNNKL